MRLSQYCKIFRIPKDPTQVALFSTLTTAVADVTLDALRDIKINKLSKVEKKTLTELGILVKSHVSERREMLRCIDDVNKENRTFTAVVALNLDCNLGCTYCYEGKRKGNHYMSEDTADDFVDFVRTHNVKNMDAIDIQFYGGEPLLSVDTIMRIAKGIRSFSKKQKAKFTFSLITNGTLLTPQIVKRLKPLGLRSANITVDGPKEVHDSFRPFKSGAGSFHTIINNIRNVHSLIKVHIGGNYTKGRYREFPALLDYLLENNLGPDKISSIVFDPVFQEDKEFAQPDFHDGCISINEPWLRDSGTFLREEILKRGFRTQMIEPTICAVERRDNLVINYDGDLYKCPGLIGRVKYRVGTVKTGIRDYQKTLALGNWKNEKCLECSYLPLCFGGCRYMKLLRDGAITGVDCKKEYYDKTLHAMVLQDVKYSRTTVQ